MTPDIVANFCEDSIHNIYEWLREFKLESQIELDDEEGVLHIISKNNIEYVIKKGQDKAIIFFSPLSGISNFLYDPHSKNWCKSDGTILDMLIKSELMSNIQFA
jgi:frataxin-like iron-binding protein CyaY